MTQLIGLALRLVLLMVIAATPVYLALSNFAVFEPYLFPLHALQGRVRQVTPDVIVGPYPDEGLLADLRHRGVTVVISLLDQDIIYEKSLIRREEALASQLGITEYNDPMDSSQPPTSPFNATALAKVKAFIHGHPHTKIYIHCYLGKHRAGDVERMLTSGG
ncbi:MAG: protein-tyrosine phosphatase family protein [Sulfuricella sp.]